MNKPLHHFTDASHGPSAKADRPVSSRVTAEKALAIAGSLQTSLDPTRLIELFSLEVAALVGHQGIRYRNEDLNLDVKLGRKARHACTYTLNLGDEPLGKLTLRRNEKFSEADTVVLEQLLCSLLYPLRNALLYQDALELAQRDPLTGICNRTALDEMMHHEVSHARRQGSSCAMRSITSRTLTTSTDTSSATARSRRLPAWQKAANAKVTCCSATAAKSSLS